MSGIHAKYETLGVVQSGSLFPICCLKNKMVVGLEVAILNEWDEPPGRAK